MLDGLRAWVADAIRPAEPPPRRGSRIVFLGQENETEGELAVGQMPPGLEQREAFSGQSFASGLSGEEQGDIQPELKARSTRMPAYDTVRRGDPQVGAQLQAIKLPILQADFAIEPGEEFVPPSMRKVEPAPDAEQPTTDGKPTPDVKPEANGKPGKGGAAGSRPAAAAALAEPATMPEPASPAKGAPAVATKPKALRKFEPVPGEEDDDDAGDAAAVEPGASSVMAQEAAILVEANLTGRHAPMYRMRGTWDKFMREANLCLDFGASIFERTYRWQDGPLGRRIVIDGLYWIKPDSVVEFHVGRNDEFVGIKQRAQGKHWERDGDSVKEITTDGERDIDASRLLIFVHDQEGADYEGISLIRHFYAAAKRRAYYARLRVVDCQRRGAPPPFATVPANVQLTGENKDKIVSTLKRLAAGSHNETAWFMNVGGVAFGFTDVGAGQPPDIQGGMRSEEESIRAYTGTGFTALGTSPTGSRAVGEVQASYFNLHVKAIASSRQSEIQAQMVEPVHALNYGSAVPTPQARISNVTPPDFTTVIEAKKASVLTFSDEDEQEFRRKTGWRPLSPAELAKRAEKKALGEELAKMAAGMEPGDGDGEPKSAKPGAPPAGPVPVVQAKPPAELSEKSEERARRRMLRQSRVSSAKLHLPVDDIVRRREEFRREFVHAVEPLRRAAIDEALEKARIVPSVEGVREGTMVRIPRLKDEALRDAIRVLADQVRDFGRETARREIRSRVAAIQGALADGPPPFDPFARSRQPRGIVGVTSVADSISEELETVIGLNVDDILGAVIRGVRREMQRSLAAQASEDEARAAARRALFDRSEATTEQMADEVSARAIAGGRAEVAEQAREELAGSGIELEYARRIHVGADDPCPACDEVDGETVEVGSDRYYALMPPARCHGGSYCHCQYEYGVRPSAAGRAA